MKKYLILITIAALVFITSSIVYKYYINKETPNTSYLHNSKNVLNKSMDEMAIDASYRYLIDTRDNNYNDIIYMTYCDQTPLYIYNPKLAKAVSINILSDFLELNKYSDNDIRSRLKIVDIKDIQLMTIADMINQSLFFIFYDIDIDYRNYQTVLFENGNKSVILLPYYHKAKMSFLIDNCVLPKDLADKKFSIKNITDWEHRIKDLYSLTDDKSNKYTFEDIFKLQFEPYLMVYKLKTIIITNNKTGKKIKVDIK